MLRRLNCLMLVLITAALIVLPLRAADLPYAAPEKLEKLTAFLATVNYQSEAGADYYQEKVRQGKELLEQLSR